MLIKSIVKKGNSNFILISKDYLDNLNLKTGDKVSVKLENDKIVIYPIKNQEKE